MEQRASVKSFVKTPLGRIALAVIATATLVGSFIYLGPLISIPTFLFFGLAIPIYLGWKRPGQLAVLGVAVLLVAAPIGSLLEAQIIRSPSPPASSSPSAPYGNGAPVLQNAQVSPFTGAGGALYNFSVMVHPENVPKNTSGLLWVELFVSTCPGATGSSSPYCPSGYPFYSANATIGPNHTVPFLASFVEKLAGKDLWWFQFATAYKSGSNQSLTWIFLQTSNGYGAVQGPVSGDYLSTVGLVVTNFYTVMFSYPGIVFFVALLIYYAFKRREATRKAARAAGLPPPTSPDEPGSSATAGEGTVKSTASSPPTDEKRCPNCQAVVYPNEATCWKCGTSLRPKADAPLASGKS